jgi:hypothetical protein
MNNNIMTSHQKKAKEIREEIYSLECKIEALQDDLIDLEDYQCVIPIEYKTLTDFLNNHKEGEEYAICDNADASSFVCVHPSHIKTHHIVLLTEDEISEVKEFFPIENLNHDWKRNHPSEYTGKSKLIVEVTNLPIYRP